MCAKFSFTTYFEHSEDRTGKQEQRETRGKTCDKGPDLNPGRPFSAV